MKIKSRRSQNFRPGAPPSRWWCFQEETRGADSAVGFIPAPAWWERASPAAAGAGGNSGKCTFLQPRAFLLGLVFYVTVTTVCLIEMPIPDCFGFWGVGFFFFVSLHPFLFSY